MWTQSDWHGTLPPADPRSVEGRAQSAATWVLAPGWPSPAAGVSAGAGGRRRATRRTGVAGWLARALPGAPSASDIWVAAASAGARRDRGRGGRIRSDGAAITIAATTSPPASRTGAAIAHAPGN